MKQSEWRKIFAFSAPFLRRHWKSLAGLIGILVCGTAVTSFSPYIWGEILDSITQGQVKSLLFWLVLYFSITYAALGLGIIEGYCGTKLNYAVEAEIKQTLMDKALHMRCSDLDRFDSGTLVSRITSDSSSVMTFIIEVMTSVVTIIITIVASLLFAFHLSYQLSLLSLAFIPLSVVSNVIFRKAFRALSSLQKVFGDRMSSFLVGTLSHIPDMKAYCLERQQSAKYEDLLREGWALQKKSFFLNTKVSLVSSAISSASTIAVLIVSTIFIAQKKFTIGNMVSFQRYIDQLTGAVSSLLQMNYSAQTAGVAVDRISELLSMEEEVVQAVRETDTMAPVLRITFEGISFAYRADTPVLTGICFSMEGPGLYAIVGENGSGKTTILKLLMRYYEPVNGTIALNNLDLQEYSIATVRRNIGYYSKDVYIQGGTLLSNLLLGSEYAKAAPPELMELCRKAGLTGFVDSLPDGLLTNVGENGKRLSSGQKQKIAVVRALLDGASVILFDEITSDLDGESEGRIVDALLQLAQEKIVLIVTHRMLPLQAAKQVLVVESGKIQATGTHRELLGTSLAYQRLFEKQEQVTK